jgi:hypothetical protein
MATKKTIKKKTIKKKVAKKNTKSMNDEKKYAVIKENRHGQVDSIYLVDSEENAKKHCIAHNLGEGFYEERDPDYEELEKNLFKLIREDKWEDVFQLWDDNRLDESDWVSRANWYLLDEAEDLMKTLCIYR